MVPFRKTDDELPGDLWPPTSSNDDNLPRCLTTAAGQTPNGSSAAECFVTAFVRGVQEMTDPAGKRGPGSVNRPAGSVHPVRSGGTTSCLGGDIIAEGGRGVNCDNYWSSRAQPRSRRGATFTRSPARPYGLAPSRRRTKPQRCKRLRRNSACRPRG
jgi:hypothetical protein